MSMHNTAPDQRFLSVLLKKYFGFESFRGEQGTIIQRLLQGEDSLVIMPTGSGKSLCYQLPAAYFQDQGCGLVLVISPLIALMEDQVMQARKKGLKASAIHSGMSKQERDQVLKKLSEEGSIHLLYVTPERFRKEEFTDILFSATTQSHSASGKVSLLAIDEAHCISLWGHDFRPDYSKIGVIREKLGNPPTVALTATATARVQEDILKQLRMPNSKTFWGGLERPELALNVHDLFSLENKIEKIISLRQKIKGPIVIYWSLIGTLEKALSAFRSEGFKAEKYHGQMAPQDRKRAQQIFFESQFTSGDSSSSGFTLFATPAFGLGIDKSDIRAVIHGEMPTSLEAYYQEVGRAGRDGMPAEGHLLFDEEDTTIAMDFIKWSCPEPSFVKKVHQLIRDRFDEYRSGGNDFLRKELNFYNSRDFRVETSINQLERAGSLEKKGDYFVALDAWDEQFFSNQYHQAHFKSQNEKLLTMLRWAKQDEKCRMQLIYEYFGASNPQECGHCDVCIR